MNFFLILELEIGLLPLSRPIRGLGPALSEKKKNNNGHKWSLMVSFVNKQFLFFVPWDVKAVWRVAWCWWHQQNRLGGRSSGWGWIVSFKQYLLFSFGILGVLISLQNVRNYISSIWNLSSAVFCSTLQSKSHPFCGKYMQEDCKFVKVRGDSLVIM